MFKHNMMLMFDGEFRF